MIPLNSARRMRSEGTPSRHSTALLLLTVLCTASIIPALQRAEPALEPGTAARSPGLIRRALDPGAYKWQSVTIRDGQTLSGVFEELGVDRGSLALAMATESGKTAFRRIRAGDVVEFEINGYNRLRAMRFDRSDLEQATLTFTDGKVSESVLKRALEQRLMAASGEIRSSLYADGKRAGIDGTVVNQIADVFKYDIDFVEDLRAGDRFQVVYEQSYLDGKPYKQGHVLAARFVNRGKAHSALRFNHNGRDEYFDETGRPLRKVLMRVPIEFARLSSNFGMRRHPVLGRMRAHKGVDYAARTGTPIMAAGDGRIELAGWKNGYGKTVIINHGQGRSTLYAHMSALGKYTRGQFVPQGAIIGRVGSTGLATGPHLHYEFRVGGKQVNPLTVTMPKPEPLRGADLAKFRSATAPALAMMDAPPADSAR